jgi:hypothetical protein
MRVHSRLRGSQSSKRKILYFLSPNPNLLSPLIQVALGGGFSWLADARSTQGASSLTESLSGGSSLVQVVEAMHIGLTDRTYRSDRQVTRRLCTWSCSCFMTHLCVNILFGDSARDNSLGQIN